MTHCRHGKPTYLYCSRCAEERRLRGDEDDSPSFSMPVSVDPGSTFDPGPDPTPDPTPDLGGSGDFGGGGAGGDY